MIPEIGIITVIGLALTLLLYLTRWWAKRNDKKEKERDEEDQRIGAANNATDMLRELDRLSDK